MLSQKTKELDEEKNRQISMLEKNMNKKNRNL